MSLPPKLVSVCRWLVQTFTPDIRQQASAVYGQLMKQARDPWLFTEAKVPDTVDGRFEMIVLHTFIYLCRLRQEDDYEQRHAILEKNLLELMFDDLDQTLREMGVGDMSVGKKIKLMAEALYGRFAAYEESMNSEEEVYDSLRRNVYGTVDEEEIDPDAIRALQHYFGVLLLHFESIDIERFSHGILYLQSPEEMIQESE